MHVWGKDVYIRIGKWYRKRRVVRSIRQECGAGACEPRRVLALLAHCPFTCVYMHISPLVYEGFAVCITDVIKITEVKAAMHNI